MTPGEPRPETDRLYRELDEFACGTRGERLRLALAGEIIALAHRAAAREPALAEAMRNDPAGQAVREIARHWDPQATTAREYAETLPVAALDRLLRAAPGWAARMRDGLRAGRLAA